MTEVLSAHGVADLMGVSVRWVWDSLAAGELPGRKVGSRWFIPRDALETFLSSSDAPPKERRSHRKGPGHGLKALFGINDAPPDVAPKEPHSDFKDFFAAQDEAPEERDRSFGDSFKKDETPEDRANREFWELLGGS